MKYREKEAHVSIQDELHKRQTIALTKRPF